MTLTLVLALLLLVVGAGGIEASDLLRLAIRQQTSNDIASLVCTALTTQNYQLLVNQVDPTPEPPAATGTFDAQRVIARFRALDAAQGVVTRCTYTTPGATQGATTASAQGGTSAQYILLIQRARISASIGMTLLVRRKSSGSWVISRASSLLTTSGFIG